MSDDREVLERRLLEEGLSALADPVVKRAVTSDPELRDLVLALQELDGQLAALPPVDPTEGLIQSTLARVALEAKASTIEPQTNAGLPLLRSNQTQATSGRAPSVTERQTPPSQPAILAWMGRLLEGLGRHPVALASAAALILGVLVVSKMTLHDGRDNQLAQSDSLVVGGSDRSDWATGNDGRFAAGPSAPPRAVPATPVGSGSTSTERSLALADPLQRQAQPALELSRAYRRRRNGPDRGDDQVRLRERVAGDVANLEQSGEVAAQPGFRADNLEDLTARGRDFGAPVQPAEGRRGEQGQGGSANLQGVIREPDRAERLVPIEETEEEVVDTRFEYRLEESANEVVPISEDVRLQTQPSDLDIELFDVSGQLVQAAQPGFHSLDVGDAVILNPSGVPETQLNLAQMFLADREQTTELRFREATGYWSNTYVPGDPLARQLRRRLEVRTGNNGLAMALDTRPVLQPFDRPESGALTLQLQSDRRGVEGETRVLLQVGLQATERTGGLRPAMNVAVVLDMRQALDEQASDSLRALLESLSEARQIGDRFGVYVAGRPGGELIAPGELRYGTVQLATRYLLDGEPLPEDVASDELIGIGEAMERAIEATRAVDDPTAPLGTSLLMLVTPGSADGSFGPVVELAHISAVGGVPVSVVALSTHNLGVLDRVALAGHGNRRLLLVASEAADTVSRELNAASQVVARALRLNIRLAPGVQLIDVLGSEHLDERRAQQEREAERSIDVRVARSLGIRADRGDDDDGIQIIIPAFYSGDSHVVLLDVVAPGPGPVADVTVRYKDLVHLRNGEASNRLTLPRGDEARGQLELNVLRNLLAWRVSEALREAGGYLADGAVVEAEAELRAMTGVLAGIGFEVPVLSGDLGVAADLRLLSVYLGQLESYVYVDIDELAESMIYASYLKRLCPLDERGLSDGH